MIPDTKDALRAYFLQKRLELSPERIKQASNSVLKQLRKLNEFKKAQNIAIYFPFKNEIDVTDLIKEKRILLPRVSKKNLIFSYVSTYDNLVKSKFGINEPTKNQPSVEKNEIDLVIVPGIVYSRKRKRIGYGAGFYDVFLKDYEGITIGVCFNEFIIAFKDNDYDISVDILLEG